MWTWLVGQAGVSVPIRAASTCVRRCHAIVISYHVIFAHVHVTGKCVVGSKVADPAIFY